MRFRKILLGISSALLFAQLPQMASAAMEPWFTGPLLASAGHTVPAGHINLEPYLFSTTNFGIFDSNWNAINTPKINNLIPFLEFSYGLNSVMDFVTYVSYTFNSGLGRSSHKWADTQLQLGFQMLKNQMGTWIPDIRASLTETLPTGQFENLNPGNLGVDGTGGGAYITTLAVVIQKLYQLAPTHFLRTRVNLSFNIPFATRVSNFNRYGGGIGTSGTVTPSSSFSSDVAFEYTLTQNWVPALDVVYSISGKTYFSGNPGTTLTGLPARVGGPSSNALSFAPALEYNFNSNVGVIGGAWFTAAGRNATQFASAMFALNWFI